MTRISALIRTRSRIVKEIVSRISERLPPTSRCTTSRTRSARAGGWSPGGRSLGHYGWTSFGVVLAAIYLLWAYQRVFHGEVTHEENLRLPDLKAREIAMLAPILALIVYIGLYPKPFLERIEPAAERTVRLLHGFGDGVAGDGIPMLNFTDPQNACKSTCLAATFTGYYTRRSNGTYRIYDADIVTSNRDWASLGETCSGTEFYIEAFRLLMEILGQHSYLKDDAPGAPHGVLLVLVIAGRRELFRLEFGGRVDRFVSGDDASVSLADRDRHGSGIVRDVLDLTGGDLRLWPVTLYGSLDDPRVVGVHHLREVVVGQHVLRLVVAHRGDARSRQGLLL